MVVGARQSNRRLRRAALAANTGQRHAHVVDRRTREEVLVVLPRHIVLDVDGAAPGVASGRVDGGDLTRSARLGHAGGDLRATHRHLELRISEGGGDRAVLSRLAGAERGNVPDLVADVSLAPVAVGAAAVGPGGRVLAAVLDPEPVVLEVDVVGLIDADSHLTFDTTTGAR